VHYAGGKAGPNAWRDTPQFMQQVQHETWTLSPAGDGSGPMRFSGFAMVNTGPGGLPLGLELLPYSDQDRAALVQALSSGVKVKALTPQMGGADTIVEFSTDPKTPGNILGTVTANGAHVGQRTGATFSGPVIDNGKWIELTMIIARPGSQPVYDYTLTATRTDAGIYISAFQYNIRQTRRMPIFVWDGVEVKP